ncbi:MAG: hypothetical protein KC547_03710 [Anaerolineae bacterium]|nr:hypothetical protein [Anaerolineae bacterium]
MIRYIWKVGPGIILILSFYAFTLQAQQPATPTPEPPPMSMTPAMPGMLAVDTAFSTDDLAPLVQGIYEGEAVLFIHTEASDPDVANLLTDMMGPQVVTVPSLAEIPETLLGSVYVFTNGISGTGPMGFQPDLFDSIPGDLEYTPLRAISRVTWQDEQMPRQVNSVDELEAAEEAGEITLEPTGMVVNMPILVWPGGSR